MLLNPGDEIDRYRVERVIGTGGMAEVYLIEHRTLGTQHALKVLTLVGTNIRDRLIQEGRVQANLKHPNLVAVTDVLDINGVPGLLMEYIDGPTLYEWLRANSRTISQAMEVFGGILSGVRKAHDADIIHRDLKPDNVLMSGVGKKMIPKVADFGLAKALIVDDPSLRQTRSGMSMGTPAYMAPEQIRDAKSVDKRADIFALGCILYELIGSKRAFEGGNILDIMNRTSQGDYTPLSDLAPATPAPIANAVAGCLMADPEKRIPDCQTLEAVLSGEQDWLPGPTPAPIPASHFSDAPTVAREGEGEGPAASIQGLHGQMVIPSNPPDPKQVIATKLLPENAPSPPMDSEQTLDRPFLASTQPEHRRSLAITGTAIGGAIALVAAFWVLGTPPEQPLTTPAAPQEDLLQEATEAAIDLAQPAVEAPAEKPAPSKSAAAPRPAPARQPAVAPEPTPETKPAPKPAPTAVASGWVDFTGADGIRLTAGGKSFAPGAIPAGTYTIQARFGAREVSAGTLRLTEGERLTLKCDADFEMCGR